MAWWPRLTLSGLGRALRMALASAMAAGVFGALLDQVSYTISPEYFERMKFDQFRNADLGWPKRWFVAEVGFLGSWWVGLVAGWFLARVVLGTAGGGVWRKLWVLVAVVAGGALAGALLGALAGPAFCAQWMDWDEALEAIGVRDATAFHRVAGMHVGAYLGAGITWLILLASAFRSAPAKGGTPGDGALG